MENAEKLKKLREANRGKLPSVEQKDEFDEDKANNNDSAASKKADEKEASTANPTSSVAPPSSDQQLPQLPQPTLAEIIIHGIMLVYNKYLRFHWCAKKPKIAAFSCSKN